MKKNDLIFLNIVDTTLNGAGVGKYDGFTVFVDSAVVGDEVIAHILKVKQNYAFAKIKEILKPSDFRVEPNCDAFAKCGGCSFRHIDYAAELKIKENNVINTIKRIGRAEPDFEPITALKTNNYRNKAQYPVSYNNGELKIGFYSNHSHRVVDCSYCDLQPKEFSDAVNLIKTFILNNNISVYNETEHKGLLRHIYFRKAVNTNEIMVCFVINGKTISKVDSLIELLKSVFGEQLKSVVLNINKEKTNVILGDRYETIYGDGYITDILCGVKIRISPKSFYQVNHDVAELLYSKAMQYAEPNGKTILDLYCGAGTIGLSMANKANKIIGVEIVSDAVVDARFNALNNNISNAEFICGDAARAALDLKEKGIKPDCVLVDPPRKGCDEGLIKTITNDFCPERVVYVSCDVATLARDIKIFEENGYKCIKAAPFDMFPRTAHVETVALIVRQ